MAAKEITEAGRPQLQAELLELRKEQFNLRMQRGTGQLTNPSRFKVVRRQIARVKTRINELAKNTK
jgi:large subunit ribosomal protein L29